MDHKNSTHCIYPPYCEVAFASYCDSTLLRDCSACSLPEANGILFGIILLGILVIAGNVLVIIGVWNKKSRLRSKNDKAKVSLAVADLMPGIGMFMICIPHLVSSLNQTPEDIIEFEHSSLGTVEAKMGGIFFLFFYSSSIYHLLYMAAQRFVAVKWPLTYRHQTNRSITLQIIALWVFSVLSGVISVLFENSLAFAYSAHTFQYLPAFHRASNEEDIRNDIIFLVCLFALPYLVMTTLTIITGIMIYKKLNHSKKFRMRSIVSNYAKNKQPKENNTTSVNASFSENSVTSSKACQISAASHSNSVSFSKETTLVQARPSIPTTSSSPSKNKVQSSSSPRASIVSQISYLSVGARKASGASQASPCINKINKQKRLDRSKSTSSNQDINKKQFYYLTTIAFMQAGFTLTVVPLIVTMTLFSFNLSKCGDGTFHFLSYYVSVASSLVNALIYSIRDKEFRFTLVRIFKRNIIKRKNEPRIDRRPSSCPSSTS